jgi:hypothetical protein
MLRLIRESSRTTPAKLKSNSILTVVAVGVAIALLNANAANAQGFGIRKIKSELVYKQPPAVHLPGDTLAVQVSSEKPLSQKVFDQLKSGFERVVANDSRLKVVADHAETVIACRILSVEFSSNWETRTRSEYKATGTHTVRNPTTDMDETVTDYGWVDVSYTTLVVSGKMTVEYQAKDSQSGLILDSEKLPVRYSRDFENGAGAPNEEFVKVELGWMAGGTVAARLISMKGLVPVLLPKGKLKRASKLFKEGHWQQAMDTLEAMPPFKNPKDDAYRHYSLGVVYEAMAFMSDDLAKTTRLLEQSATNYRRATELKPREDHFWQPWQRAESALAQYRRLNEQLAAFEERRKGQSSGQAKAQPPVGQQKRKDMHYLVVSAASTQYPSHVLSISIAVPVITNDTVINWAKSGTSEDYIVASIKHSPGARFDLSPPEQARLKQSGVTSRAIKAMRDSQTPRRPGGLGTRAFLYSAMSLWPYLLLFF